MFFHAFRRSEELKSLDLKKSETKEMTIDIQSIATTQSHNKNVFYKALSLTFISAVALMNDEKQKHLT